MKFSTKILVLSTEIIKSALVGKFVFKIHFSSLIENWLILSSTENQTLILLLKNSDPILIFCCFFIYLLPQLSNTHIIFLKSSLKFLVLSF